MTWLEITAAAVVAGLFLLGGGGLAVLALLDRREERLRRESMALFEEQWQRTQARMAELRHMADPRPYARVVNLAEWRSRR